MSEPDAARKPEAESEPFKIRKPIYGGLKYNVVFKPRRHRLTLENRKPHGVGLKTWLNSTATEEL